MQFLRRHRREKKRRNQRSRTDWFGRFSLWLKQLKSIHMESLANSLSYFAKRLNRFAKDRKVVSFASKEDVRKALISALLFTTFLIVNVIVMQSGLDRYMYFFNNRVKKAYVDNEIINTETNTIQFSKLITIPMYWDYMEYCVLKLFYGTNPQLTDEEKRNLSDTGVNLKRNVFVMDNHMLGTPRLRQQRVANRSCSVPREFSRYFESCYAVYSDKLQLKNRLYKGTYYESGTKTFTEAITGNVETYSGGGYTQEFTWNASRNLEIIRNLRDTNWIDRGSRMVVFEYSIYNHNLRMYGQVQLLTEVMPTGFIISKSITCTVKDYSLFDNPYLESRIAYVILYIMMIYYTTSCVVQIYFAGFKKYFRLNVNRIEVAVIFLHMLVIFYNIWHWHRTSRIGSLMKTERHMSLDKLCTYNFYYQNILGILSVLLMIQIFQFLQFNMTVKKFIFTLKKVYVDLFGFLVMSLIAFLTYAQLGILLFSKVHYGFQSFLFSVMTLTSMVLRNFDFTPLTKDYPITGTVFLVSFIFIIFCILLNMFMAFVVATFTVVVAEMGESKSYLFEYIKESLIYIYQYVKHLGKPPTAFKPEIKEDNFEDIIDLWDESREMELSPKIRKLRQQMRELDRIQRRTEILEKFLQMLTTNMQDLLNHAQHAVKRHSYKEKVFRYSKKK